MPCRFSAWTLLAWAAGAVLSPWSAMAAGDEPETWQVGRLALPAKPVSLGRLSAGGSPLLELADGTIRRMVWSKHGPELYRAAPRGERIAQDLIPDGHVAQGHGQIRLAWLAEPTGAYDHGILGDKIEAAELRVQAANGAVFRARAPEGSVFEDLTPRLWDLDADGNLEAWVVRSGSTDGARLEAYEPEEQSLVRRYGTSPIGLSHRWLNPVGVGDFTGDGSREVALVQTPHIGGILTFYRAKGADLVPIAGERGFSNHAIGSRQLDLAWVGDLNGDGADDVLLPEQSRRRLVAVSFKDERFRALARSEETGHIETNLAEWSPPHGDHVILFGDDSPALRWVRLPD